MKNIVNLVKLNRKNRKPLALADFGDKTEFNTYIASVDKVQVALANWARKDWQGIEDKKAQDTVFDTIRELLAIFNDDDFVIKADMTSVRSLRDVAFGKKTEYSPEYKAASERLKSFANSIKIHLQELSDNGVVVPHYTDFTDLIDFASKNNANGLDKAIENHEKIKAEIEEIKLGEWSWYVPYCNNKNIFRVMVENFVADRAEKCQFDTLDLEAIRAARRAKNKARREAKKAAEKTNA